MIIDRLVNSDMYNDLTPGLKKAFEFLKTNDLENMEVGRYEVDGDKVVALVQEKTTQLEASWESHDHHIDLQFIISGQEKIGYYPVEGMKAIKAYDAENDFTSLEEVDGDYLTLRDDIFMLLYPEDGHQPAMAIDQPMDIKKVVVKILV